MTFRYDQEADALTIQVLTGVLSERTEEIDPGTLVDLDQRGRVVAIEVLQPEGRRWPLDEIVRRFDLDPEVARMLEPTLGDSFLTYSLDPA